MIYILLTFFTAFGIEALGTYVSIIGLSTLFGANPIIMAVAIALDVGKLLVVSLLYTYWSRLGFLMKSYALIAAMVTMTITSAGAMGYLSGEFQKAIMGSQENTLKVDVLKTEQAKLEDRKKQIDLQIAELPKNYSSARIKLMQEFSAEQKQITDRLAQINTDLPTLQIEQIGVEAKVGPILYISKAFDVPVEVAVKWVILMIVFVFDPLAVFLIIAGNFLLHLRRVHKDTTMAEADLFANKNEVPVADDPKPEAPAAPVIEPELEGPMAKTWDDTRVEHELIGAPELEFEGPMAKTWDDTRVEHEFIGSEDPLPPPAPEPAPEVEPEVEPEVKPEVEPEVEPVEELVLIKPQVAASPQVREVITREQLQPPAYFSSLNAVPTDDSIEFTDGPSEPAISTGHYRNLK